MHLDVDSSSHFILASESMAISEFDFDSSNRSRICFVVQETCNRPSRFESMIELKFSLSTLKVSQSCVNGGGYEEPEGLVERERRNQET